MKYCQTCGAEIQDSAEICPKCGVRCAVQQSSADKSIRGKGLGVVLGLFLGIIGIILCHFIGDEEAKKGSITGFVVTIAIGIIYGIIVGIAAAGMY